MNIQEISRRFQIPEDKIQWYESLDLIKGIRQEDGSKDYKEEQFRDMGLISIFLDAGFTAPDIERYMGLSREEGKVERIRILRSRRGELLEEIHKMQKTLDCIDYLIWQQKNESAK